MIRSHYASAIALAALVFSPAFAQTTTNSPANVTLYPSSATTGTAPDQQSGARTSSTEKAATPRNRASAAQRAAIDQGRTPLCSELGQPNAGKLADRTTGMANDRSASAVHMDCLPDGTTASAGVATGTNSTLGSTASNTGKTGTSTSTAGSTGLSSNSSVKPSGSSSPNTPRG
jgi:hypothetical protein